jgi:hypothetical protein
MSPLFCQFGEYETPCPVEAIEEDIKGVEIAIQTVRKAVVV